MLKKNVETNNILVYNQLNIFIDITNFIETMLNL